MTVSPAQTAAFLRRREANRQRKLDERFRTAREEFHRIVELLAAEFAPHRIWQWHCTVVIRHSPLKR